MKRNTEEKYPLEHPRFTVQEITSNGLIITRPARLLGVTPQGPMYEGGPSAMAIQEATLARLPKPPRILERGVSKMPNLLL